MKTVYNNIIPFKGSKAITIYPFVFVRKSASFSTATYTRHTATSASSAKPTSGRTTDTILHCARTLHFLDT